MFHTYTEAMDWLYSRLPMFSRIGAKAIKPGLDNIRALCEALGNPQSAYPTIHIAGTNGKGSSSHTLAAILQSAGYKTGLHTSPHLKKFNERVRINGIEWSDEAILDFINTHLELIERVNPSYFEISVAMAFYAFAKEEVDVAIIETGVGGRLDSTNILSPILSLITNIGWDHTDILGDTLEKIASEKAGIIKQNTPVVISKTQPDIAFVFQNKAKEMEAPIQFASDLVSVKILSADLQEANFGVNWKDGSREIVSYGLTGTYQEENLPGILVAIKTLQNLGWSISKEAIAQGLAQVKSLTGLKGRWQILNDTPLTIADTGHNKDGLKAVFAQLEKVKRGKLYIVFGIMADKDFTAIVPLLPKEANYIACAPNTPRALPSDILTGQLIQVGLYAENGGSVLEAYTIAKAKATPADTIFIGGSTFVVGEIPDL